MCALLLAAALAQEAPVARLLRAGDEAYAKRGEPDQAARALTAYRKALVLDEAGVAACIGLAKTCFWTGTHEPDPDRAAAAFREGIDACKRAVFVDGGSIDARFWLAVLYGLYGQSVGIMQSLDLLEPMKAELDWVLKKDEAFEDAGAHRVYGRLYHKLPGIKGGDLRKAETHLRRAVELAPKNILNRHYLAEVLVAQDRRDEAKEALRAALAQPDDPRWLPECREQRADAKKLLERLE